jgi:hypothetical protein
MMQRSSYSVSPAWRCLQLGALAFAVTLAACETTAPPGTKVVPPIPLASEPSIVLSETQAGLDSAPIDVLRVAKMRDLWVRAFLPHFAGTAMVDLQFFNPHGELFLERHVPFSAADSKQPMMSGAGHKVDVYAPTKLAAGYGLDMVLPVGGSPFDRDGRDGEWTMKVTVTAGSEVTAALARTFQMDLKL